MVSRRRRPLGAARRSWLLALPQLAAALRSREGAPPASAVEGPGLPLNLSTYPDKLTTEKWPEDQSVVSVARDLSANYERLYSDRVREVFEALEEDAVLTVSGYVDRVLINFVMNLKRAAKEGGSASISLVNAMLDSTSLETCRQLASSRRTRPLHIQCVDIVGMLPNQAGKDRPQPRSFLWAKPVVFRTAVQSSRHSVLMADVDVVFYQNLLPWAWKQWISEPDVVLSTATEWGTCCNTGTVYANRDRSMPLLNLWVEANNRWYLRRLGDQDALFELAEYNISDQLNISNRFALPFPWKQVVKRDHPYRIALFNETIVKQQCRKCKGYNCRGPAPKGVQLPYANHYNCINTHMNPEHTLRSHGNWSDGADDFFSVGTTEGRERMMMAAGDWCELEDIEEALHGAPEGGEGATSSSARGGVLQREVGRGLQR